MATYTHNEVVVPSGIAWNDLGINGATPLSATATLFVIPNSDGTETRIIGNSFTYDINGPTGGTVTQIDRTSSGGGTVYETVIGLSLSLVTLVTSGSNLDPGGPNAAPFALIFAGVDTFNGWSGTDVFTGGAGGDTFNGSTGTNFVSYFNSLVGLVADIGTPANNTGDAVSDVYNSISGLIGSSFNDTLRGDGNANTLVGGDGNDILGGRGGADFLSGGNGFDYAAYSTSAVGILASLATPASNTGDAAGDTYSSIEGLIGSNNNDTLIGDTGNNFLRGGLGADSLDGGSGTDYADYSGSTTALLVSLAAPGSNTGEAAGDTYTSIEGIRGGSLNDTLVGDGFSNALRGGAGADSLDGGNGTDIASYRNSTAAIVVDLSNTANNTLEAIGDIFVSIEGLEGSDFNDTLTGDSNSNVLRGHLGADSLVGGGGFDYTDYRTATAAVLVSLTTPASNTGDAAGDTFSSIEGIIGSDFNDTLIGDGNRNYIRGGLGADSMDGGASSNDFASYRNATAGIVVNMGNTALNTLEAIGDIYVNIENLEGSNFNDTLVGDANGNKLEGGAGADSLDGGAGFDYADYALSSVGLLANLANPAANTGDAAGDTYANIEALRGSDFNDTLIGDAQGNQLDGGLGADSLDGGAGSDSADYRLAGSAVLASLANPASNTGEAAGDTYTSIENLRGSDFNDTLIGDTNQNFLRGGLGADSLVGGNGGDWASYFNSTVGLVANLTNSAANTGEATGDIYVQINALEGSAFNDTLVGNNNGNVLRGGSGADSLDGSGGTDYADYAGAAAGVLVSLATPGSNTGDGVGDTYTSIEGFTGSSFNDTLIGDASNNFLVGNAGADSLDGGAGSDFAEYRFASSAVLANLGNAAANTGEAAGDTYTNIENLTGSNFNDTLIGDNSSNSNFLRGGLGADSLDGGNTTTVNVDYADYGTSSAGLLVSLLNPNSNTGEAFGDTYTNIRGIAGSSFNDTLIGDGNINFLRGGSGADSLDGGGGSDWATYQDSGSALLVNLANSAANTGIAAGDTFTSIERLIGSGFNDTLIGDGNVNFLRGGAGADSMDGAGGSDWADYNDSQGAILVSLAAPGSNTGIAVGDTYVSIENLRGGSFNDTLIGDGNDNILRGGLGADSLNGGSGGIDTADYRNLEGAAVAPILASLATPASNTGEAAGDIYVSIENLTGTDFNDTLIGDGGANQLDGSFGNDSLDGGLGTDTLIGGAGDDTYLLETYLDQVVENAGEGTDTVISTSSYIMAANVENLTLVMGAGLIDGLGNSENNVIIGNDDRNGVTGDAGNDTIIGNGGDDAIDGGIGADSMVGGTGVDTYYVDNVGDAVVETEVGPAFYDTVWTNLANYTLPANVEIYISINGAGSINGEGNDLVTLMLGNEGNNILNSYAGDDIILGRDGNDTINGGTSVVLDVISGGVGADLLTGGGGHDYFNYELITHGGDVITDFQTFAGIEDDILDFRPMFFPTFTNTAGITTVAQAVASGHLTYTQVGADTQVFADADGGGNNNVLMATLLNTTAANVQTYTLI